MRVLVINRMPYLMLAKNAFFRGNCGFVGAFMLVSAFLGYMDGREAVEIGLDIMLGLWLCYLAIRAYGSESQMYKHIWGESYYKMQKIALSDSASLSEEEVEIQKKYCAAEYNVPFEIGVTAMAIEEYSSQHDLFEKTYNKEHKTAAFFGNVALFVIILNIVYCIVTHI